MHKKINIISFDVDGTLVDPEYNDLIWFKEIPELLAKERRIPFKDAVKIAFKEYEIIGSNDLKWYELKYWISYFNLKISNHEILKKYEPQIKIFSSVIPLLEDLKERYELIVISAMPREFLSPKMLKLGKYFTRTFSAISDFKQLKNIDLYIKISQILKVHPSEVMHIGDGWKSDYLSAKQAGMNTIFLDRSNKKVGENIINDLEEVRTILKTFEEN